MHATYSDDINTFKFRFLNEGIIIFSKNKYMKHFIIILSLAFTSNFLYAQININEEPYIEVIGRAEIEVIPDMIYISISIKEREEDRQIITVQEQEKSIITVLNSLNIDLKNFSVENMDAIFDKKKWKKGEVKSTTKYTLLLSDFETTTKVFEKLDALNVDNTFIEKLDHSKIIEYKKEVRIQAIKAAKTKSDYLLEAIGAKTGLPLVVRRHSNSYDDGPTLNIRGGRGNSKIVYANEPVLQFKTLKIKHTVFVKFQIKE